MSESLALYTIGHSNLTADDFLALLRQHDITVLVDIRSTPYSRFVPHFSKKELEYFIKQNSLDYRFAGEYLGGQPKDESVYKGEEVPVEGTNRTEFLKLVDYVETMKREWYLRGIQRLLQIIRETKAQGHNVAIMCSEGNPRECHRHHMITRSLLDSRLKVVDTAIEVKHILRNGDVETVEPAEFEEKPAQPRLF